jgi:capsular polysaccharide biosynthesis protein
MAVDDQIAVMRGARVFVAPSGAALANVIFAPQGATVLEIRPEPVREPWVDLCCDVMGLRHVVVPAPLVARGQVPLWARMRQAPRWVLGRYHYAVRVDVAAVLAALDGV